MHSKDIFLILKHVLHGFIYNSQRLEQDSWSKEQKLTIKFQHKEESMMKKMDALKQDCAVRR